MSQSDRKPFVIVHPLETHSKLAVDHEGLAILRQIEHPVAPVVVIGPYRSGKSFLLNQLLGVGCDEGFGVGHTRNTQTKGVWFWGSPVPVNNKQVSLVFFDTEGFESTGKADAYDDRIFALSALLSSVLIYNLPETVRESDLEKLSFATELAEALYGDASQTVRESGKHGDGAFEAANMLWVIQRDFLEGKTPQQMLEDALKPVPNPAGDNGIAQVNRVRTSLQRIAANSTATGLAQPHLERTKLCTLPDSELNPTYVKQRDSLRVLVHSMAKSKVVAGKALDGRGLADLIEQVVGALNARDIPTAGSLVDYFNKELVELCVATYIDRLEAQKLPVSGAQLQAQHDAALGAAEQRFAREKFGNDASGEMSKLRASLQARINREYSARTARNEHESSRLCESLEMACEDVIEAQQHVSLPSMERFRAKTEACRAKFEAQCVGPAFDLQQERMQKLWHRELDHFRRDYNDRLYNGLVLFSLGAVLCFRFILRFSVMETLSWVAFIFLQVYPKLYLSGGSMYETLWWHWVARAWELLVYNPLYDLLTAGPLLFVAGVVLAAWRWAARWGLLDRCQPWLDGHLPWVGRLITSRRARAAKTVSHGQDVRDLDV